MPSFTKPTDTAHKIQLESHLIYALWMYKRAHAGQEAELEVKTSLVGNGAKIKITCKNENGKKLDKTEGVVFNNFYRGKVLVPENVKPDEMIFFEAELPKHGLKGESNSIPVRPPIQVTQLQWDRKEVKREDIVTLTCQFQSGVEDDDDAIVIIYEHNPNSCDLKVVSIPTVIKDNKIEMQWKFDYQDDTSQIPTDEEMKPYQKNYANPQFYFVVVVDGVKTGENRESGLMKFLDQIKIQVYDESGQPIANPDYKTSMADGNGKKGALDEKGSALLDALAAGPSEIEFTKSSADDTGGSDAESSEDDTSDDDAVSSDDYEIREIVIAEGIQFHESEVDTVGGEESDFSYLEKKLAPDFKVAADRKTAEYVSDVQEVRYKFRIVYSLSDFKTAIETPDIIVVYSGHARLGRGPCLDPYDGSCSMSGDQWEDGTTADNGIFRMGYKYIPIDFDDLREHGYTFKPVPAEWDCPPNEAKDPCSRHPHARRSLSKIKLPDDLQGRVQSGYVDSTNHYWGYGKNLLLHAGWESDARSVYNLQDVDIKCKTFCHFGCSTKVHNWAIVRKTEYKGWVRPEPPTEKLAYFTTGLSDWKTVYWLYFLLKYNEKNSETHFWDSHEDARKRASRKLNAEGAGYQIY
jgi:hypothetical protein